jgi:hypothetical protein
MLQKKRDIISEWFKKYTSSFVFESDELQQNIVLKREHSLRVRDEIIYLADKLGLTEDETALAEITALLHDAGRFEQFCKYRTFADKNSVNHAELGIRIIQDNGLLEGFDSESERIILKSILYHNRPSLPEEETRVIFFSKLLRDADKLDIWKVVLEYYSRRNILKNKTIELELPDTPGISSEVYDDIMNHNIVNMSHVRNLNDFKLLQAAWIFDINFKPSFDRIIERNYLAALKHELPETEAVIKIFQEIDKYINDIKFFYNK